MIIRELILASFNKRLHYENTITNIMLTPDDSATITLNGDVSFAIINDIVPSEMIIFTNTSKMPSGDDHHNKLTYVIMSQENDSISDRLTAINNGGKLISF